MGQSEAKLDIKGMRTSSKQKPSGPTGIVLLRLVGKREWCFEFPQITEKVERVQQVLAEDIGSPSFCQEDRQRSAVARFDSQQGQVLARSLPSLRAATRRDKRGLLPTKSIASDGTDYLLHRPRENCLGCLVLVGVKHEAHFVQCARMTF